MTGNWTLEVLSASGSSPLCQVYLTTRNVANAVTLAQGFGSQTKENLPMRNDSHPLKILAPLHDSPA